jgi:hypothetical protein
MLLAKTSLSGQIHSLQKLLHLVSAPTTVVHQHDLMEFEKLCLLWVNPKLQSAYVQTRKLGNIQTWKQTAELA